MKLIEGKVFWITGASSGIGKSLAILALKEGAKVVLSGRNQKALDLVADEFGNDKKRILVLPFDLAVGFNAEELTQIVVNQFGRIDYLINNGGISQRSLVAGTPVDIDRKVFEVNFFGNISLAKAVLNVMIAQRGGHIAVTSSVVGKFGFPLRSAYSASKHALHGFYESLRAENYSNNIKVSMIIPGRINTDVSINAITQDGSSHGQMDPGQANGMTSNEAAARILKGILKGKKEIVVGKMDVILVSIRRYFPRVFYFLARKINPK